MTRIKLTQEQINTLEAMRDEHGLDLENGTYGFAKAVDGSYIIDLKAEVEQPGKVVSLDADFKAEPDSAEEKAGETQGAV